MTKHDSKTPDPKTVELLDLLPKRKPLPGEDAHQMQDLRQALLLELAPSSPLEHMVADDIFNLLWDSVGHRRWRDALIRAGVRLLSQGAFHDGKIRDLGIIEQNKTAEKLGYDLVSEDPDRETQALTNLAAREVTTDELIAKAYASVADAVAPHEARIADIELRRRKLLEDYRRLKAATAEPVEDAVLVDAHDH